MLRTHQRNTSHALPFPTWDGQDCADAQLESLVPIFSGDLLDVKGVVDAQKAIEYANLMLQKGVYVIPFSFPVVPKGKARIRTQISAAHSKQELQMALDAFSEVKRELGD